MASHSPRKLIGRLTQPQYELLKSLTDEQALDATSLDEMVRAAVEDRMMLARGLIRAAKVLANHEDPIVRRSAASRAYYGAYHAARATVFRRYRRDEDDHDKLPGAVDLALEGQMTIGDSLKGLRRLRNEMDYSPYPGPDLKQQYAAEEIEEAIATSLERTEALVDALGRHVGEMR